MIMQAKHFQSDHKKSINIFLLDVLCLRHLGIIFIPGTLVMIMFNIYLLSIGRIYFPCLCKRNDSSARSPHIEPKTCWTMKEDARKKCCTPGSFF